MTPEDLRKAAELLEAAAQVVTPPSPTITRLAAGLRAMADAEPVAWQKAILRAEEDGMVIIGWEQCTKSEAKHLMTPTRALYTTPQRTQWVGLTEDERQAISLQVIREDSGLPWRDAMVTAIESALRAKNGGAA